MKLNDLFESTKYFVVEAVKPTVGREYQHVEDLLITDGAAGGIEGLNSLRNVIEKPHVMNVKWDGMAVVFWGRNEKGEFIFSPKNEWTKGKMLSREQLAQEIENTGKQKSGQTFDEFKLERKRLSSSNKKLWDLFEKATPLKFRGYLNGDILFISHPMKNLQGDYEFTPNKVTYTVKPGGLNGKIDRAKVFVAVHGKIDEYGVQPTGHLHRVSPEIINQFNKLPDLIVLPIQYPTNIKPIKDINKHIDIAVNYIRVHEIEINRVVNFSIPKISNFKKILYDYAIQHAKRKVDFDTWLKNSKLSDNQKELIEQNGIAHSLEFEIFWEAYNKIVDIKLDILEQIHEDHGDDLYKNLGIRANIQGQKGGEGYAWAANKDQLVKAIHPAFRSDDTPRFNNGIHLDENEITEPKTIIETGWTAVWTLGRFNPIHYGHVNMIKLMQKIAKNHDARWYLFTSNPNKDKNKNPLTYDQKIYWIEQIAPETRNHLIEDPNIKTPLNAAQWLYNNGCRKIIFVAGENDMPVYSKMIENGNNYGKGLPNKRENGTAFYFGPLTSENFIAAPRLASATNARLAVMENDREKFVSAIFGPRVGKAPKALVKAVKTTLFDQIQKSLSNIEK